MTVVGEPGIGKSRLVTDAEMRIGSRARVLLSDDTIPPHARAVWTAFRGELESTRGNVERGRKLCRVARALAEEIGDSIAAFWVCTASMEVELLAGELTEAEALARENLERCERMGHGWPNVWRVEVARVLLEQERMDEAGEMLARIERLDPRGPLALGGRATRVRTG